MATFIRRGSGGLRARARRFIRRDDGVAAVEFAMVAGPFFALLFAIVETAVVFFASQTLESAAADSARLILTGQAQTQGLNQATFKQAVCNRVAAMFNCADLKVDVRKYATFAAASQTWTKPVDANGKLDDTKFGYQPGAQCEIVIVRLVYGYPVYVPSLGLDDMADGKRLLVATSVFRNEPFQGSCS